jgi:hypothetical protein
VKPKLSGNIFLFLCISLLVACGDGDGDGTQQSRMTPVKVQTNQKFISLSHRATCGLTGQGQAYCWGSNSGGQVGRPPYYEIL